MADVVTFFKPSERGRRVQLGKNDFTLTFIDRPRGVRFNSALSKRLTGLNIKRVQIWATEDEIVVKPTAAKEESFSLIGNKHAYHVSAAAVFHWAEEKELAGKKLKGVWDGDEMVYKFPFEEVITEEED